MVDKQNLLKKMQRNAKENGYFLCPDKELLDFLLDGLTTNTNRYGYGSCPCRVASGIKTNDGDIVCPCEYRDADVNEFGMCYCGLFVNQDIKNNPSQMGPIPERRPREIQDAAFAAAESKQKNPTHETKNTRLESSPVSVWRCTVCGYLCARESPPPLCPICKAKAERFERFTLC